MTSAERLRALDAFADSLKDLGEDFVSIAFRKADELVAEDRYVATVHCPGKPLGLTRSASTASGAFIKVIADRSHLTASKAAA